MTAPEKISILGGTIDPPHWVDFTALFQLDRLLLIPSGNAWQKSASITLPETRYQLTQAAVIALHRLLGEADIQIPIEVDRIELDRQGGSSTPLSDCPASALRHYNAHHLADGADKLDAN